MFPKIGYNDAIDRWFITYTAHNGRSTTDYFVTLDDLYRALHYMEENDNGL